MTVTFRYSFRNELSTRSPDGDQPCGQEQNSYPGRALSIRAAASPTATWPTLGIQAAIGDGSKPAYGLRTCSRRFSSRILIELEVPLAETIT
jgi:hypothetical protein